jgi:hypothetical protein
VTGDPWGRVDSDGTVYLRTADGERVVGSWQAGEPAEALEFFERKYEALLTEVGLLEQRITTTDLSPAQADAGIGKLREALAEPHVIGDIEALRTRVDGLASLSASRREEAKVARDHARHEARGVKERIVAEAERIAVEATHWKNSGERLRQLVEEWKTAPRIERPVEAALWKRMSTARSAFAKRRKAYFADLEGEREQSRIRKEKLIGEAESLSNSTDWATTAARYRDLMRDWKSAGRAARDVDDRLWARFKAAQDVFFAARSETFAERDAQLAGNAIAKEQLLAEAEKLLPVTNLRTARNALRSIQERWEDAGPVPRESRDHLEGGLRKVEETIRKAEDSEWKRSNPEARARAEDAVNQLRTVIAGLEAKLEKAKAGGSEKAIREAGESLEARRAWLTEAEHTLDELS